MQINVNGTRKVTFQIKPESKEKQTLFSAFQIEILQQFKKYRKITMAMETSIGFSKADSYIKTQTWLSIQN